MSRLVFRLDSFLETEKMVNQEHGFFGPKGKTKNSSEFNSELNQLVVPIFKKQNYDFAGPLQDDCSIVFFIRKSDSTFGLFYKCAERFVCPIERFVRLELEQSGHFKNSYLFNPTDFVFKIFYQGNHDKEESVIVKLTAKREYIRNSSFLFLFSSRYEELESRISERTIKTFNIIENRIIKEKNENKENPLDINIAELERIAKEREIQYQNKLNECIKEYIGQLKE